MYVSDNNVRLFFRKKTTFLKYCITKTTQTASLIVLEFGLKVSVNTTIYH